MNVQIKQLEWQETFTDRGDGTSELSGWECGNGFGNWYDVEMYFGSDSFGFQARFDGEVISDRDDPQQAKDDCQAHFEDRIRSALVAPAPAWNDDMKSAPQDKQILAITWFGDHWSRPRVYRYVDAPNYWVCDDHGGICIRPDQFHKSMFILFPDDPPPPASGGDAAPIEDRKAFVVPDGYVAVRDAEGRATGEVVPAPDSGLVEALEFYADPQNWTVGRWVDEDDAVNGLICIGKQHEEMGSLDVADCGDRARAALAAHKGVK